METKWTPEKIDELMAATRKHIAEKEYAQAIADGIKEHSQLMDETILAYEAGATYDELKPSWDRQTKMEQSLAMKIKHFFVMVYGRDNVFCRTLRGEDYWQHTITFKDFVSGPIYGIKF